MMPILSPSKKRKTSKLNISQFKEESKNKNDEIININCIIKHTKFNILWINFYINDIKSRSK
jgi:hypothetical protein